MRGGQVIASLTPGWKPLEPSGPRGCLTTPNESKSLGGASLRRRRTVGELDLPGEAVPVVAAARAPAPPSMAAESDAPDVVSAACKRRCTQGLIPKSPPAVESGCTGGLSASPVALGGEEPDGGLRDPPPS